MSLAPPALSLSTTTLPRKPEPPVTTNRLALRSSIRLTPKTDSDCGGWIALASDQVVLEQHRHQLLKRHFRPPIKLPSCLNGVTIDLFWAQVSPVKLQVLVPS